MRFFLGVSLVLAFALWWLHLMQAQSQASGQIERNVRALARVHQVVADARRAYGESNPQLWRTCAVALRSIARDLEGVRPATLLVRAGNTADNLTAAPRDDALNKGLHRDLDDFVLMVRRENAIAADDLNGLWRSLRGLALMSLAFAGATLALLILVNRRQSALRALYGKLELAVAESASARGAAEHANATKTRFLANLSHELRTPLTSVIGMIDLALTSHLDLTQRQQLETADRSARSLLLLINDILDFSRLEAGRLRFEISQFAVRPTVDEAVGGMAAAAQAKGLDVRVQISPDVAANWRGNGQRVRQVLTNLLSNAIKFTDRGAVTVRAQMGRDLLLLSVVDTGPGMSTEDVPRLFEPFTQLDDSMTRRQGGAGLGLSICRELVEYMGGTIEVESTQGQGTTLTVRLPAIGIGDNPGQIDRAPPPPPPLGWRRVWLDLPAGECTECVAATLRSWGVEVRTQADGPVRGEELALRQLRPDLVATDRPWAAVATLSHGDAAVRARELGANWLLFRPIRDDDLRALVAGIAAEIGRADAYAPVLPGEETPPTHARAPQVLVVEDDPVAAAVITAMLRKLGCASDLVGDGAAAVVASAARSYDLVLMDCQLPEMDGISATRTIRDQEADSGRRVPVVALSASGSPSDLAELMASGFDDYLEKPTTIDQLAAMMVKRGLKVSRRRRQTTTTPQAV
ncbi:MAG: response regulator [Deltaproteobacteria bacterium]|nr:response regulator [Deltaproteobacteria bacterium]